MSRRKIKIDVWKYIRPILMGLGAVLEEKLDSKDRALRLCGILFNSFHNFSPNFSFFFLSHTNS